MLEAETKRSLLWWLHQDGWELFWEYCDPLTVTVLESEALKSVLVPKPFVRIGWVATLRSFVRRKIWACFLYHLMPKNASTAMKMPRNKPTQMPIITKSPLWTILWSLLNFGQWKHLAGKTDKGSLFQISTQTIKFKIGNINGSNKDTGQCWIKKKYIKVIIPITKCKKNSIKNISLGRSNGWK